MCQIALACAATIVAPACAARTDWARSDARSCVREGPPRLCVRPVPDQALVIRAGGEALVPGECALSPRTRGGLLRVTAEDGRTGTVQARWLRTPRGTTTTVATTARGKPLVSGRARCTGEVE